MTRVERALEFKAYARDVMMYDNLRIGWRCSDSGFAYAIWGRNSTAYYGGIWHQATSVLCGEQYDRPRWSVTR